MNIEEDLMEKIPEKYTHKMFKMLVKKAKEKVKE